jgi:hypothetical protein
MPPAVGGDVPQPGGGKSSACRWACRCIPPSSTKPFAEFAIFAVLYRRFGKAHRRAPSSCLYLLLYGAARFMVEFFRYHEQGNLWGGAARHLAVDLARPVRCQRRVAAGAARRFPHLVP